MDDEQIDVGHFVRWNDCDGDVPEGDIGEVTGWKDNERVYISFPRGSWHFPIDELEIVDRPKRGREEAGGPPQWRPSLAQFECWNNAINTESLQTLAQDAVESTRHGNGWLWISAKDEARCTLEHFAQEVFRFHTGGDTAVAETGGVEFKVEVRRHESEAEAEDRNEHAKDFDFHQDGTNTHPALCSVTFLSGCGAPIVVFDTRASDLGRREGPPRRGYVSYPVPGKHVSFLGDLIAGTPDELSAERLVGAKTDEPRVAIRVNIWPNGQPQNGSTRLEQSAVDKMSQNENGDCLELLRSFDCHQGMMKPYWVGRRAGRGEMTRCRDHQPSLTAALPVGVFRQALWWRKDESELLDVYTHPSKGWAHSKLHSFWVHTR